VIVPLRIGDAEGDDDLVQKGWFGELVSERAKVRGHMKRECVAADTKGCSLEEGRRRATV
jgi:hypothetical protein